jgi:hypothetical protein
MVELTLQGILSTPFEPKGITGGKSVYHVSEHVFRMSPVYTERSEARRPWFVRHPLKRALKVRDMARYFAPSELHSCFGFLIQGRRTSLRSVLAPGSHIFAPLALGKI